MERNGLAAMTVQQLKELAAEKGITILSGMKKAEMIDAILAAEEVTQAPEETTPDYDDKEKIKLVYVGPTLPDGLLTTGKTLWGTEKSIMDYIAPELEAFPKVKVLLGRQEKAAKARSDIRSGRGIYYKYYQDLIQEALQRRKRK